MIYVCVFCTNFTFSVWLRRKLSQKGKKKRKKKKERKRKIFETCRISF